MSLSGEQTQRKLVILGDGESFLLPEEPEVLWRKLTGGRCTWLVDRTGACGKTSMLTVFTKGFFPQGYEPTVFEN